MSMIELELSDEEKAQLMASLTAGLSESSVVDEESSNAVSVKKTRKSFIGPPRPANRDGMGRYVPGPGEKPLSVMDEPSPGPGGYLPQYKLVQKRFPEFSMGEGVSTHRAKIQTPAPNKYDIRQDLAWGRCKKISMKKKLFSKTHELGPGPAAYVTLQTSLGGPKHRIAARPKTGAIHGLVSTLASIPDPTVPGPFYKPLNDEWLQKPKTFGLKTPLMKIKGTTPGPNAYVPKIERAGPKWAMRNKLKDENIAPGPGPASYELKPLVPEKRGVTMGIKHAIIKDKNPIPGPDEYNRDRKVLHDPGYTLQYRWFDRDPDNTPGPGYYRWRKDPTLRSPPAFTFRPSIPKRGNGNVPGPGHYNVSAPPLDKGRSIGLRLQPDLTANPSPADYCPEKADPSRRRKAPAHSLAGRHEIPPGDVWIGPGSYEVQESGVVKPAKSFGLRIETTMRSDGPGPAPRSVRDTRLREPCRGCECDRAATVKGRHTPHKYSGFRNMNIVEKPRRDFWAGPFLG